MPLDPDAIDEAILDLIAGPKRVQVGDQEVENQSVDDLLKARNAIGSEAADAAGACGLKFFKFIPPGAG